MILWPCLVTLSNGSQFSACKVFASPDGTDVWVWDAPSRSAVVLVHGPGTVETDERRDVYRLTVEDGTDCRIVVDARDCGCSHPLKYFRPAVGAQVVHADQR